MVDFGRSSAKLALCSINKVERTAEIIHAVEEKHPRHGDAPEDVMGVEHIAGTLEHAFAKMRRKGLKKRARKTKQLVVGLASEMIYGHAFSYIYKRENPESEIDLRELKNAVHNAEVKAYEDIRRKFVTESGYKEGELALVNSTVQEVRVDGYRVPNAVGFEGRELLVSVFNAYLPNFYKQLFDEVIERLGLEQSGLIYEPYTVFHALRKDKGDDFEALIIDVGGKTTRVSLVRKGKLEDIRTFSFGGESFTRRLSAHFRVGFWEAESMKRRYSEGKVSTAAKRVIDKTLERELSIFLGALEMILKDFSRTTLLPSDIYLYGGGSTIPLMDAIIRKRKWKQDLSFLYPPKIHRIDESISSRVQVEEPDIPVPLLISTITLVDYLIDLRTHKDSPLSKTLKRMVNIIQE